MATSAAGCASVHLRRRGVHGAFTLIELLVVVAIITTLLAILLPAMSAARAQANRSVCQSNLHQIAIAWEMYLDENEDHFLQGFNTNVNYGGRQGQGGSAYRGSKPLNRYLDLPPLVEDAQVFRCPTDEGGGVATPTCFEYYGSSYNTNPMLIGQDQLPALAGDPCRDLIVQINRLLSNLTRTRVTTSPSELLLLGDFGWRTTQAFNSTQRIEWHDRACAHNLAFLDGHVEFLRIRKGLHLTPEYTIIPFRDLLDDADACQRELPCE